MRKRFRCVAWLVLVAGMLLSRGLLSREVLAAEVDYNRDVRPILADRCFHCHGPAEDDRQGGLRLDRADGPEGAYRESAGVRAIEPGAPEASEVWERIQSDDPDVVMPPPDSHKEPLSDDERALIRQWIELGAEYNEFWAFRPPTIPALPSDIAGAAIDRIVQADLRESGMVQAKRADRRTLIRRVMLDLTGLPPSREQLHAFLQDDRPGAYERMVDRALASPRYGEHLARYWLDLVRFADTNGIHHDHYRELTPYRDWVIRAFNDNLPYDDFVRYQLAGDLYASPTQDQLVASGFHRLHLIIDRGTMLPEESFSRNVIDRVTSVGTAFLGLTLQCAVCHDHKYDPITMRDFYAMSAFFNNIDADPETGGRSGSDFFRGLQPPYVDLPSDQQKRELAALDERLRASDAEMSALESQISQAANSQAVDQVANQTNCDEANQAETSQARAARLAELKRQASELRKARDELLMTVPAAMVMRERPEPRPTFILVRGAYDKPGEEVTRDTPGFLPPMQPAGSVPTRMDLANWFVDPGHPLTARVAVNRFWQQLFGVGLVRTSEDFGAQGEWPSHPELLDYLAVRFVQSGWDVKELFKEIVMSETYRQSSHATREAYTRDPANRRLARGARFRVDSEVIRDQVLFTSGLLNDKLYGKSVKPPQPEGLWKAVSMPSSYPREFQADTGADIFRRSVYTFWKRGMPPPQMTILNAPSREECIARRERTNTPLQALLLMNEAEYLKAARQLAKRILDATYTSDAKRLEALYETITCQLPSDSERDQFLELLGELQLIYAAEPALASELTQDGTLPAGASTERWAAWTMVASSIYNLDITKTRQ